MDTVIKILLYIWQLPQNIAGIILFAFRHRDDSFRYYEYRVGVDDRFVSNKIDDETTNGISLGQYIILEKYRLIEHHVDLMHEYGHCRQSELLGWFYLPIVGLCSGAHNLIYRYKKKHNLQRKNYYAFWTERWADRLGGVKRDSTK